MSAQIIPIRPDILWALPENKRDASKRSMVRDEVVSGVPFEVVYQTLYGPEPSAEDVAREYFLLECD